MLVRVASRVRRLLRRVDRRGDGSPRRCALPRWRRSGWSNRGVRRPLGGREYDVHAFAIPAGIEAGRRKRGKGGGLFGWQTSAPWANPAFAAPVLAIFLFGFLGGITGVLMGQLQLNMTWHNTFATVGHFHSTVVLGTTMTSMGQVYFLIRTMFGRRFLSGGLASAQPFLYGGAIRLPVATGGRFEPDVDTELVCANAEDVLTCNLTDPAGVDHLVVTSGSTEVTVVDDPSREFEIRTTDLEEVVGQRQFRVELRDENGDRVGVFRRSVR